MKIDRAIVYLYLIYFTFCFHPVYSFITNIQDIKSIVSAEKDKKKVVFFSAIGCRACTRFRKKAIVISKKNPGLNFYDVIINDSSQERVIREAILKYSKKQDIVSVPSVVIHDGDSSECISCVPRNYHTIETMIRTLHDSC